MIRMNMMIRNKQSDGENEEESLVECEALCRDVSGGFVLEYKLETGDVPLQCEMKVLRDRVEMRNRGAVESCLIFQEHTRKLAKYITPYGPISMEVSTQGLRIREDESEGRSEIWIVYDLHSQGALLTHNRVHITAVRCE